jgi:hypothetical protein
MTDVIHVVYNYIIAKITTDDSAVVQAYGKPDIVKREIKGLEFSNANQSKKFAILNKLRIECIRHQDIIPIV